VAEYHLPEIERNDMNDDQSYIYRKNVDKSLLSQGISIPITFQRVFQKGEGQHLKRGESRPIKLLIDAQEFHAILKNQAFDEKRYPNHVDILQIRYTKSSGIPTYLQEVFQYSVSHLNKLQQSDAHEYLALYMTSDPGIIIGETISMGEIVGAKEGAFQYPELELETILDATDDTADLIREPRMVKIRKLDREIGNSLKQYYQYRCQICGENIGSKYDQNIAHCHHIVPFSLTLNNNSNNLMVVCPNHHSVIHTANPTFDWKLKMFIYRNGITEKLRLNDHI